MPDDENGERAPEPERLLKRPIIRTGVDRGSRGAVCIDLFCRDQGGNDRKVGSGSGFLHRRFDRDWVITNWHVLTGRHPDRPNELLPGFPDSPSHAAIYLPFRQGDQVRFLPTDPSPLYDADGRPQWAECGPGKIDWKGKVDLAAVPIQIPDEAIPTRVEDFTGDRGYLRVGREVVIVGYPFGIRADNPFPTWKRGAIASEPSILIDGMLKYYVDMPGRPGMSGSPVFMISKGMAVSAEAKKMLNGHGEGLIKPLEALAAAFPEGQSVDDIPEVNILQFAGIYAGSLGDRDLTQLNLGIVWHGAMVDLFFENPAPGDNPFPPASVI